ncbi:helix-turn-helix transcriptional regulator [Micromonospora sp. CA-263727]|uniref:helix-turn-helix transcriptional regulator n=1 Tax=Micromonospora sp. CA-263727 TaxID=3239967 RepID=UPI003D936D23
MPDLGHPALVVSEPAVRLSSVMWTGGRVDPERDAADGYIAEAAVVAPQTRPQFDKTKVVQCYCCFIEGEDVMAKRTRSYMPTTRAAVALLGSQIAAARKERGWTAADLAERVGVQPQTIGRLERGTPTVALGVAFEAAVIVGIPLFAADERELRSLAAAARQRLALLPTRVTRPSIVVDDNF